MTNHDPPPPTAMPPVKQPLAASGSNQGTLTLSQAMQEAGVAYQCGDWTRAELLCRLVLKAKADYLDALNMLGIIAAQTRRTEEAADLLGRAVAADPSDAVAHLNYGRTLQELKRLGEALDSYDRALQINPDYAEAHSHRGNTLNELKRFDEALDSYVRALKIRPNYPEAYNDLGVTLKELRRFDEALDSYDRALEIKPGFVYACINRGNILKDLKRFDEALVSYDRALKLEPGNADAYNNLGVTLKELKRFDEALESYDRALKVRPDYAEAYSNRGNALQVLKRFDEALDSFDRALRLKPDFAEAYVNRGHTLHDLKRFGEALDSYDHALELKPDCAEAYVNKALALLLVGDFSRGLELNEWRWKKEELSRHKRNFEQPLWLGDESLAGKRILLHSEQGSGDTIQFCRYAKLASDLGARVVVEVEKPLAGLLKEVAGVSELIVKGDPLPAFDYHCPLLSLPLAFKTDLRSIPRTRKYLSADIERLAHWARKLGERTRLHVGLVWSGSTGHNNDHNRSIALADIVHYLPPQCQYVSLQKEVREADMDTLASRRDILQFGGELQDFADTAALCELMDVVVSVDTSVAHLTGALGKTVWILLPYVPDWRWLLDREDSPWYPTAKLYRQERNGDWAGVFEKVEYDLVAASHAQFGPEWRLNDSFEE